MARGSIGLHQVEGITRAPGPPLRTRRHCGDHVVGDFLVRFRMPVDVA